LLSGTSLRREFLYPRLALALIEGNISAQRFFSEKALEARSISLFLSERLYSRASLTASSSPSS